MSLDAQRVTVLEKNGVFCTELHSESCLFHDSYFVIVLEFLSFSREGISVTFIIYLMLLNCIHYLEFLANDYSKGCIVSWAHFLVKPQWRFSCYILCTLWTL